MSAWATSLTVPSPPTATIRRHPAETASLAISVAWPGPSVITMSASRALSERNPRSRLRISAMLRGLPERGLTTKRSFIALPRTGPRTARRLPGSPAHVRKDMRGDDPGCVRPAQRLKGRTPAFPGPAAVGECSPERLKDGLGSGRQSPGSVAQEQLAVALLLPGDHLVDDHWAARRDCLLGGRAARLAHDHVVGHEQARNLVRPPEYASLPAPLYRGGQKRAVQRLVATDRACDFPVLLGEQQAGRCLCMLRSRVDDVEHPRRSPVREPRAGDDSLVPSEK